MTSVKAIPDNFGPVTPYLVVKNASSAIDFYKRALGAQEIMRMPGPNGSVTHAEISIGGRILMLADENPRMNPHTRSAETLGGSPVSFYVYVNDVDAVYASALAAGAKQVQLLQDMFYGDRTGAVIDPFGLYWTLATHKEDVAPEEMRKRAAAAGMA